MEGFRHCRDDSLDIAYCLGVQQQQEEHYLYRMRSSEQSSRYSFCYSEILSRFHSFSIYSLLQELNMIAGPLVVNIGCEQ